MAEDITKHLSKEILLRAVISSNLKKLRKKCKMTQDELALRTRITRVSISRYESCKQSMSLDNFVTIAKALGASPNDLLDGWETLY